jgi:hypothetical protein
VTLVCLLVPSKGPCVCLCVCVCMNVRVQYCTCMCKCPMCSLYNVFSKKCVLCRMLSLSHTLSHTHTHTYTHTLSLSHTHTLTHSLTRSRSRSLQTQNSVECSLLKTCSTENVFLFHREHCLTFSTEEEEEVEEEEEEEDYTYSMILQRTLSSENTFYINTKNTFFSVECWLLKQDCI